MEPRFKNSFIPKRPIVAQPMRGVTGSNIKPIKRPTSLISILATLLFLASIVTAGAVYGYAVYISGQIEDMDASLKVAIDQVDQSRVSEFSSLNSRLSSSKKVLNKHLVSSEIFNLLESLTLHSIRYTTLDYSAEPGGLATLNLEGETNNYSSVALESDVFSRNPFVSTLNVSDLDVNELGKIVFSVSANLKTDLISYPKQQTTNL